MTAAVEEERAQNDARPAHPVRREPASPSIAREVAKFVVASLAAVLVFVAASLPFLRHLGRTEAIREARSIARLAATGVAEPNLENALLRGDDGAIARMDRVVQERILSDTIVRVKIWTADGRILYSDEPRLIGARYRLGEDEHEALEAGGVAAELSDLNQPENRYERAEGELLEVYSRVRTPNGTPLLFELYERFDSVTASGRRLWLSFLPPLLVALLLLWLVQVPLAYRLARRVRQGHAERALLLQRALDASNDERRRIAAELHDGVVQDLAGVSYSLAASAEATPAVPSDPTLTTKLREAASVIRASIQRLRSLLLEIHPPNLRVAGLTAALEDVVAPLRRRGIDVELDLEQALETDPETEALVFRAAREAIGNIVEHAEATRVRVSVRDRGGLVHLIVEDNGVGFDPQARSSARSGGHVGLTLLEEHAAHANARLAVDSEPGLGTTFTLEVPS